MLIDTWFPTNMTSGDAPNPFIATASTQYNDQFEPWRVFDINTIERATAPNDCWATALNQKTGWVQIDLGRPTPINKYRVILRGSLVNGSTTHTVNSDVPNTWSLSGSNDGINFVSMAPSSTSTAAMWTLGGHQREIYLNGVYVYRYYRLNVTSNSGTIVTVGGFHLFLESEVADSISWFPRHMTSNTLPSPFVATASTEFSSAYRAYQAFNYQNMNLMVEGGACWATTTGNTTGWLQIDLGKPVEIVKYRVGTRPDQKNASIKQSPNAWTVSGSNDGKAFTVIDTQSGHTTDVWLAANKLKVFDLKSPAKYRYYRISPSVNNGATLVSIGVFNLGRDLYGRDSDNYRNVKWLKTAMTSDTTSDDPALPYVALSEPFYARHFAWHIFRYPLVDIDVSDVTAIVGQSGYFQLHVGRYLPVRHYRVRIRNRLDLADNLTLGSQPRDWTLSGSDDGINFTTIDTRTNYTAWSRLEPWTYFELEETAFYNYYRLTVSDNMGYVGGTTLGYLEFGCDPTMSVFKNTTNGKTYTVINGVLTELPTADKATILAYGIPSDTTLDISTMADFESLVGVPFEVVTVSELDDVKPAVLVKDVGELPRIATSDIIDSSNMKVLKQFSFIGEGIRHALSIDSGVTWLTFKDGAWVSDVVESEWMTSTQANALTQSELALFPLGDTLRLRHSIGANDTLTQISIIAQQKDRMELASISNQSFNEVTKTYSCTVDKAGTYQLNYVDIPTA